MRLLCHFRSVIKSISVKQHSTPLTFSRFVKHHSTGAALVGKIDKYNGITVNLKDHAYSAEGKDSFETTLQNSVSNWKASGIKTVWLKIPSSYGQCIEGAARLGFQFHNAEGTECLMKLWLDKDRPDPTPIFATHQLGVCGVVLREDTNELLVITEKKTEFPMWKFPGGLADLGENIGDAAVRETLEETGIKSEFASIIAFRQHHFHPNAFGRSDLYVICRLKPMSYKIKPCEHEISKCRWMPIEDMFSNVKIASITHRIVSLMLHGVRHGFHEVDIVGEEMESVHREKSGLWSDTSAQASSLKREPRDMMAPNMAPVTRGMPNGLNLNSQLF